MLASGRKLQPGSIQGLADFLGMKSSCYIQSYVSFDHEHQGSSIFAIGIKTTIFLNNCILDLVPVFHVDSYSKSNQLYHGSFYGCI